MIIEESIMKIYKFILYLTIAELGLLVLYGVISYKIKRLSYLMKDTWSEYIKFLKRLSIVTDLYFEIDKIPALRDLPDIEQ